MESDGIKAHHNVGGLPEDLKFELVEPIRLLYKDEVRVVGKALGLPDAMVNRQPFPGPGLGVRCTGAITRDRLNALREADAILREEFEKAGLSRKVWQYFVVIPDFKTSTICLDSYSILCSSNHFLAFLHIELDSRYNQLFSQSLSRC